MDLPQIPYNEAVRLDALRSYEVLDTLPEELYDDITRLASEICQTPIALISLVDKDRQWFKSHHGLAATETPRDYSYCAHAINEPESILEVEDAFNDDRFFDNPLATGEPFVRFYSGAPLKDKEGQILGTLCVIDHKPKKLTENQKECLWALSRQVMSLLHLRKESHERQKKDEDFNELVENLEDGIFELGSQWICLYANPKMLKMLNMSTDEVHKTSIWEMICKEDIPDLKSYYLGQFKKKAEYCFYEFRLKPKNRPALWVNQSTKIEYDTEGRVIKVRAIARDLSESKNLKRALQEKESLYWLVSENSSDLIALHELDATYKFVSYASRELLGYSPEEMVGKNPYDFIHKDDITYLKTKPHKEVLNGIPNEKIEYRIRHAKGHFIWMQSYAKPIFSDQGEITSFQTSSRDITEKKQEEIAKERYSNGLTLLYTLSSRPFTDESLIEESLELVADYLMLTIGIIAHASGDKFSVDHYYSTSEKQINLKKTYELTNSLVEVAMLNSSSIASVDPPDMKNMNSLMLADQLVQSYLATSIIKGGSLFGAILFFSLDPRKEVFSPYDSEFLKLYSNWLGAVLENIDERSRLKREKVKAEEASASKAAFLSMMSHEIRTPLNGIIGATHLLLNKQPKIEQVPYLKMLRQSGDNLHAIVNDILDFNKIEEGKLEIERTLFDLNELLDSLFGNYQILADDKGIEIEMDKPSNLKNGYWGDPVRISQVLHNFLSNAIKFTEKGKVTISLQHIASHGEFDHLQFSIQDTGIGIPKEKHKEIFEVFSQQDSSITRKFGGSGLGLSITKRLLDLMDSDVTLDSDPKWGSTFSFDLILESQKNKSNQKDLPKLPLDALEASILLVEDNEFNAIIATEFMELWGCKVKHAINGVEALVMLNEGTFDLVLLDLQMPEMDGYETIGHIRKNKNNLPVIALTAAAMGEEKERVFQSGMNDYLSKPVNPSELHKKLYEHLKGGLFESRKGLYDRISSKLQRSLGEGLNVSEYLDFYENFILDEYSLLHQAIQNKNLVLLKAYAHKNKSSFQLVGLDEYAKDLKGIEKMIAIENPDSMVIGKAIEHYDRLTMVIKELKERNDQKN